MSGNTESEFCRGDSRIPEGPNGVFNTGFKPVVTTKPDTTVREWIKSAIRPNLGQTSDAQYQNAVCMTPKFESAAVFPLSEKEEDYIYIYVMSLPPAIHSIDQVDPSVKMSDGIVVFDLHQTQTAEAYEMLRNDPDINPGFIAVGLYAYEIFTSSVPKENIVCAIKCKRKLIQAPDGAEVYANIGTNQPMFEGDNLGELKYLELFDREFVPVEIQINSSCTLSADKRNEIVSRYSSMIGEKYQTTPIAHGLGGKTLPLPIEIKRAEVDSLVKLSEDVKNVVIGISFTRAQIEKDIKFMKILLTKLEAFRNGLEAKDATAGSTSQINFVRRLEKEVTQAISRNEQELIRKEMGLAPVLYGVKPTYTPPPRPPGPPRRPPGPPPRPGS